MEFIRKNFVSLTFLLLIGFVLYAFNLRGPLFWDDADWITNNPFLHALTWTNIQFIFSHDALAGIGSVSNYYRPFLFITFLLNYVVSGTGPFSYHLVSNLIHLSNGIMLYYLVDRWIGSRRAAFLASLLFIIHPLQTESVAYISGRGDPLSIFFILGGIILWLNNRRWLAGLAAILAVLSRETAVLFPAYLMLALIAFESQGRLWPRIKNALKSIWPYIGISAVYVLLRLTVLNFQNTLNFYQQANVYSSNLLVRVYTFFHVLLEYLRLMAWPTGLHMDRDVPVSLSLWQGWSWLGLLVILLILGVITRLYKKSSKHFYPTLFGCGLFFVALAPSSGIVPINARIYEHWLYLSIAGVAVTTGYYLDLLFNYITQKKKELVPVFYILIIGYCLFLSIQTIRRNILWTNQENLYTDILRYEEYDVRVLNNLGNWYSDHNHVSEAEPLYLRAIEADPYQPAPYHNLGNIARDNGELDKAIKLYEQAIAVEPRFHYSYENIASIYLSEHRLRDAITVLERLDSVLPDPKIKELVASLRQEVR